MGTQLLLVAGLVLLNAVFAGSEIALLSLRQGQLDRLRERSRAGRVLADLAGRPNRYLSTIQVGITLAGFLASATAAVTLAQPLVDLFEEPLGGAARPVAVFLVTALLTFVTLVLGELAPKRLAMQRSEGWALLVARPLAFLAVLATPVIWVLSVSTNVVVRLLGGDPEREREEVTHEEVVDTVASAEIYEGFQRRVIEGALEISDRSLRQVLTPRPDVVGMPRTTSVEAALTVLSDAGHTRAPVWTDDLDDADAYVTVLSLIGVGGTVADHATPALVLPESVGVLDALWQLQAERRQMALVVDEYGAVAGLVTVEDLVEEIVGEIYDEHDRDLAQVIRRDDGSLELPGRFPLHDLPDLAVPQPDSDETTVGGHVVERLGRVPDPGDRVDLRGWTVEVVDVTRRRVRRVVIHPPEDRSPSDGPDAVEG